MEKTLAMKYNYRVAARCMHCKHCLDIGFKKGMGKCTELKKDVILNAICDLFKDK